MEKIHALIVDDEILAVEKIKRLLKEDPEIEITGECYNGRSAVEAIRRLRPELLFLDVQMPGMDGFDVLLRLGDEPLPFVVFVTAYDTYAVRAFEVHAIDYLLKPFDRERFKKALQRVKSTINQRNSEHSLQNRLNDLLAQVQSESTFLERFVIKSHGRIFFLRTNEIDWIEAAGNYVKLHSGKATHLIRTTMNTIESQLDPKKFMRIHRSTIVQLDQIKEIQPWFNGEYLITLHDETKLTLSRTHREKLRSLK
jgi:two-component system, LytTR family, response regulator